VNTVSSNPAASADRPALIPGGSPALLLVLAGPAGSGKTTLCKRLVDEVPGLERVVTSTTRAPRGDEVNGRDYYFFSDAEFDRLVAGGAFLEWARVHGADRRYGTLRKVIDEKLAAHIDLCMNVDVQGVASIRAAAGSDPGLEKRLVTVFIMPPSLDELRRRLLKRGTDNTAEIERRMETAQREMREWVAYDFCVRSGTEDEDFAAVRGILAAERNRVVRLLG
jgi:guanylate kinase